MSINHLNLAAADVTATQRFYERFLGFRKARDHGKGVFLRGADGFLLALEPADVREPLPGWFHLGFCARSENDALALHREAVAGGATIVRELVAEPGSFAAFYLADPDGRRVEISWHRDAG